MIQYSAHEIQYKQQDIRRFVIVKNDDITSIN